MRGVRSTPDPSAAIERKNPRQITFSITSDIPWYLQAIKMKYISEMWKYQSSCAINTFFCKFLHFSLALVSVLSFPDITGPQACLLYLCLGSASCICNMDVPHYIDSYLNLQACVLV